MGVNSSFIAEIDCGNQLGESVVWHEETQTIWWTDILACKLYSMSWPDQNLRIVETPEPLASFAFTTSLDVIVGAFATGFAFFNVETLEMKWISKPGFSSCEARLNDGRVDPRGRFWAGTMTSDDARDSESCGHLYRLDPGGVLQVMEQNIGISNGLAWSPDGATMYFADSRVGEVYAWDFDVEQGTPSNKRLFYLAETGGSPDGACIDQEGCLWTAIWGLGKVLRINPEGDVIANYSVPAVQPACVAFGGALLDLLFVTSARQGLSPRQLEAQGRDGNLFVMDAGVGGLPTALCTLKPGV